ncbi:hypothetical protein BGW37DRAFT_191634 [Umbelopsis sp. PMI_123]|nr:hypothetical protein BGW37DRAFT_191634 [Umbelopsis sp. PMI_123]
MEQGLANPSLFFLLCAFILELFEIIGNTHNTSFLLGIYFARITIAVNPFDLVYGTIAPWQQMVL